MLSEVCRWKTDPKIGRYFVPGCMGGAVYGEAQCTCGRKATAADRIDRLEGLVERLQGQVADLSDRLATHQDSDRG